MPTVSRWAREIVAKRAAVVLLVGAAFHVAVVRGWLAIDAEQTKVWTERVTDVIGLALAAGWARGGVTTADPKLAPRALDGRPLVPVGSALARPPLGPGARATGTVRRLAEDQPEPRTAIEHPADGTWSPEIGNP